MAANVVRPGRNENGVVVTEPAAKVNEIKKEWSVIEDGALAHKLQEEENTTHYSGNISRRRTVRSDIRTAKSAADEEALQAFKEEHDIAEKNRQRELEDAEAAKKLLQDMMEEEKQKIRELRQRENEERDREAAKELYQQMMEDEKRKHRQQRSFQETDEELALRLQAHEERKQRILSQKHHSLDQEMESERLAHHLAREEKMRSRSQRERAQYDPTDDGNYLMPNVAGLKVAIDEETVPELPARKHKPKRVPRQHSAPAYTGYPQSDSDEETDVIALIQDDEELARRLQREEIQRSRAPSQKTEQQRKQLIHDQKIAIKMQHEEVMFSKKKTYDNYMGKVKDEIADPEPMVHVSRQNKTAVPVDAKYAEGVQLTDYTAAEVAQQRRTSGSGQAGVGAEGNIMATIDPTFNKPDPGNVVLLKKTSLNEEPPPPPPGDDGAFNAVPGSKRKDSKDKGKRSSIFSKLKKK
ncbi:trichohyalin-like isoform X2 [Patiria miniata]|uniref:Coiled-coil domain-containing protein n=1 Tax=Patiria miniata TaxID=46514 RepID=A0A914BMW5_PATMI|nr:trichohyalin-like isoform X2 [Patiria miniata]